MKCPYCGYIESRVIDSRPTDEGERIRRRRECLKCGKRFTTYEVIENVPIVVIKKDKSRETFDRNKLLNGLLRACEKRPVSMDTLERIVDEIENLLQNSLDREVDVYKRQVGVALVVVEGEAAVLAGVHPQGQSGMGLRAGVLGGRAQRQNGARLDEQG